MTRLKFNKMCADNLVTAIVGLIGVGIGSISYWIERKDRYRFVRYKNDLGRKLEEFKKDLEIKYEVRIKTHQEAFSWVIKLNDAVSCLENEKVREIIRRAREWWNQNCFYLDKDSRVKFLELMQKASSFAAERSETKYKEYRNETWELVKETLHAIQSGIKVETLDVLEKPKIQEDKK